MSSPLRALIGLAALLAGAAHADAPVCEARTAADRAHLVELYTSEGCNSCPPAEKWLGTLRDNKGLIGLEFHVDYWDSPAWRDPYAKQVWAKRQEAKARGAKTQVYTPQIWVDGRLWRNWPKGEPPGTGQAASVAVPIVLRVALAGDGHIKVALHADAVAGAEHKRLFVALTENRLMQEVRGGENKGRHLEHDQVVRDVAGPLSLPDTEAELKLPEGAELQNAAVVAYLRSEEDGGIDQVLRLPLRECQR